MSDTAILYGHLYRNQVHVWCIYCCRYHYHGAVPAGTEVHRLAHCDVPGSAYREQGYQVRVTDAPRPPRKRQPCLSCGGGAQ